jgi:hypothetical protein
LIRLGIEAGNLKALDFYSLISAVARACAARSQEGSVVATGDITAPNVKVHSAIALIVESAESLLPSECLAIRGILNGQ